MKTTLSKVRALFCRFLIFVLVVQVFIGLVPSLKPVKAQNRVIVINADQPNVWTLEQAHYLLAQMHRRNLDLKATGLGNLDPNEINGLRFDVLRQLVELGVEFNQAERETNRLVSRNQDFNAERRQTLLNRRDALQDESLALTREMTDLQTEKVSATTQEEKDSFDARIAAKSSRRAEVDKRVEQINEELKTLNAPSGSLTATEASVAFDPNKLPKSSFDDAFKEAAKKQIEAFNQAPKLNATLRLENFLQMQYEIIAKQLTLLRDEVGPGERLLFLELPQTVNVTHHEADKKWAQSWWRVAGYMRNCVEYEQSLPYEMRSANRRSNLDGNQPQNRCWNQSQNEDNADNNQNRNRTGAANRLTLNQRQNEAQAQATRTEERINRNLPPEPLSWRTERILRNLKNISPDQQFTDLSDGNQYVNLQTQGGTTVKLWDGRNVRSVQLNERTIRTVELIPRQSSLNVNDMNLRVRSGALSAVGSFLFGFGARLNVQRQREQFSQFVQQELYSSAFGKGSREFGWTFTPMPGTERLMSGVRTTYAVVVVPEDATYLLLESNGCYFPRSAYQPNDFNDTLSERWRDDDRTSRQCAESKAFLVPVPVGGNGRSDFFVEGVTYQPVDKGERIVVSVHGYNFSGQTGVMVNGSPLTPAIGLAQPLLRDDSETGRLTVEDLKGEKVKGRIERIDSEQIVFSFEMPPAFTGTPTITLVAPGKAIDLNRLIDLYINKTRPSALTRPPNACAENALVSTNGCELVCSANVSANCVSISAPMFNLDPEPKVRIDAIEAFRSPDGRTLTVLASGKGFDSATHSVFVNGEPVTPLFFSPSLIRAAIYTPRDETVQVVIATGRGTIKSKAIPNPAFLRINNVTIVAYEPASKQNPVAVLLIKLEGTGFSQGVLSSTGNLTRLSSTEALLRIQNPALVTPLTLFDPETGFRANTVITLPTQTK
jgi:hypothetical protein